MRGRVKYFDVHRGFGFLVVDGMADVFVHAKAVHLPSGQCLAQDQEVEFSLGVDKDGRSRAENVTVINRAPTEETPQPYIEAVGRPRRYFRQDMIAEPVSERDIGRSGRGSRPESMQRGDRARRAAERLFDWNK